MPKINGDYINYSFAEIEQGAFGQEAAEAQREIKAISEQLKAAKELRDSAILAHMAQQGIDTSTVKITQGFNLGITRGTPKASSKPKVSLADFLNGQSTGGHRA